MKITVGQLRALIHEVSTRAGKKIEFDGTSMTIDRKSDPEWIVLSTTSGAPIARQSKASVGKRYAQGTNPDYDGFDAYELDQYVNGEWHTYSSDARKGEILDPTFLRRTLRTSL
jgi:hypothetical protein